MNTQVDTTAEDLREWLMIQITNRQLTFGHVESETEVKQLWVDLQNKSLYELEDLYEDAS